MPVDVHSHFFRYPEPFSQDYRNQMHRMRNMEMDLTVHWEEYAASATKADRTIVFGGKARRTGIWVPDLEVAEYVRRHPERLIGFLSVDPTQPGWQDELEQGHRDLGLRGIKLLPIYAGFDPQARELDHLWEYAERHGLPVLVHTGTTFLARAPLEFALPRLLDTVATRFPDLRIVMAHMSHPYEGECVATIRKHPNVYADCSALHYRPFQLYHSLMLVQEYGVWDKVLFGSDYPVTTVDASVDGIRDLNRMVEGTALPCLDADSIDRMLARDTLSVLGL